MTRLFVLAAFALSLTCGKPRNAHADYSPTAFFELAGMADYIVVGTVTDVREKTFVLRVEETVVGEEHAKLEIKKFNDWACAWRWAPYEPGQTVLVFLTKENGELRLIGAGAESEAQIVGDDVYCPFGADPRSFVKHGRSHATKLPLKELRDAISEYRRCFRTTLAKKPHRQVGEYTQFVRFDKIERICTREELDAYARRSKVHKLLVDQTIREQQRLRILDVQE